MAKRQELKKHTGASAGYYNHQQEQERRKGSVGFNVGPDHGKRGHHLRDYYVTSEDWHHNELSHGMARGTVGLREAKRITRRHHPHKWMKFKIAKQGWTR